MKKIITISIGNTVLFLLLGLALLFPFSKVQDIGEAGFSASFTVFPLILLVYLIIYPIIYYVISKQKDSSELSYSDEREKTIVAEATKTSYIILVGGLMCSMVSIAGLSIFSLFTHESIDMYSASIIFMTLILITSSIAYCIKWCIEYRK